jgi:DNA polymerase III, alpha subunit
MDRVKSNIPFVGLHAHSVAGSPFDGFGYPQDHMDFAYQNGCDALALTDHGNANGLSYQVLHAQKMQKEGKDFKPIFGVEAYFIESLDNWRTLYEEEKQNKKTRRSSKKADAGISAEADGESKQKAKSVLNKRRHLVLLAQNQTGLNNIFKLISTSFQEENFYRYPRMRL